MKIVYIALKGMPSGGGIEKYTEEVGSRLVAMGHEVVVYTMRHYGAKEGIYKGMQIRTVPTIATKSMEKLLAAFNASLAQIHEKDVDIVHYHSVTGFLSPLPHAFGRKTVTQCHGLEWKRTRWGSMGRKFLKILESPAVRWADAVTVVSKVQQEYLKAEYGIESEFIPTGVNPPELCAPNVITERYGLKGNDYALFASRLVKEKCAHHLIEAFRGLDTSTKLVIAGDAQHEESYKASLRAMAAGDDRIQFTGFVTGQPLAELMSNCACFVLPSEIEGLPTVLLEAMSYGTTCLASDIPENREALDGHGHTFNFGDVSDLRTQLNRILANPEEGLSLSLAARDYVLKSFSWDDIARSFDTFYQKVLAI